MSDAEYGELIAVVGMFNQTNKMSDAYKIPVDEVFLRAW
jgi:alkylhydroperoxidase family enzyme